MDYMCQNDTNGYSPDLASTQNNGVNSYNVDIYFGCWVAFGLARQLHYNT